MRRILLDVLALWSDRWRYSFPGRLLAYFWKAPEYHLLLSKLMAYVTFCRVEGDYLEFGVYEGRTLASAYWNAQRARLGSMRFYAFDSFEGLPDDEGEPSLQKGSYCCSENTCQRRLKQRGVDLSKVVFIKGWYSDTLNQDTKNRLGIKSASIIWVDCDLYQSTRPVLDFVFDYIVDGTVIAFDDWYLMRGDPEKGEQRAFREWLEKNPTVTAIPYLSCGWDKQCFILRRGRHEGK